MAELGIQHLAEDEVCLAAGGGFVLQNKKGGKFRIRKAQLDTFFGDFYDFKNLNMEEH